MQAIDATSLRFLTEASLLYRESCPELSRYLMQRPRQSTNVGMSDKGYAKPNHRLPRLFRVVLMCQHCCQWFQAGNQRVRLRPKRRPSAWVQSALRREARGKRLSLAQKELLRRFRNSSSTLMATCHSCSHTSRYNGVNRDFITKFSKSRSTPGSAGKHKTPQAAKRGNTITPKSVGKDKTPSNTPRSVSSNTPVSGSSSTKSPSGLKKWVVQRLSKILTQEDKQGSKKGSLKDFLSSL